MGTSGKWNWMPYHNTWTLLFAAWTVCYLDRSVTGPVVSWMIANGSPMLGAVDQPHSLGGLIGSMFFAGYMLTQFPAGYLGDRFGRKTLVVISTLWAGVATTLSGASRSLSFFVGTRVLTGLGEGAYYSNDRALVAEHTPPQKVGTGMGVVFVGLSVGMTAATMASPWLIDAASGLMGERAWALPFLLFGPLTVLVGLALRRWLPRGRGSGEYAGAFLRLALVSVVLLAAIMGFYQLSVSRGLGPLWQGAFILASALLLTVAIFARAGRTSSAVLRDRSLWLMYVSAVPILFTLWFFGFWALLVVSESSGLGLTAAAAYAALFGAAGALGYPLGGVLCDRFPGTRGRKRLYFLCCTAVALLVLLMVPVTGSGGLAPLAVLLFSIGVLFAAMQTVHMTLTSDLSPPEMRGQAFGMWNLVAEVGAVISPLVCGWLRDLTGEWAPAMLLTAALLAASAALVMMVPKAVR